MSNLSVGLLIRYKDAGGTWRRSPAARGRNGRVRSGYAQVRGKQIAVASYTYDLRVHEGRVSKYIPAGANAVDADAERRRREKVAAARAGAEDAGLRIEPEEGRRTLKDAATKYMDDARARGAMEAMEQARVVMDEFQSVCRRIYVDEITRDDILRFHAALRKRGCAPRTVANKHARLKSCLLFASMDASVLPPKPRYDATLPTVYTSGQIDSILEAADATMALALNVALKCGLREQELMHLEWRDIDWKEAVLRVRSKPDYGFRVKDAEERDIPIPRDLFAMLQHAKESAEGPLALGGDTPRRHLLRELKTLARKAGLNCGVCEGCRGKLNQCQEWTLHKFRRTYCTTLLRNGIDLRTVQAFMGHADLASTMRYLRPAASKEVRDKINAVKFG